jgi:hypothetical protein
MQEWSTIYSPKPCDASRVHHKPKAQQRNEAEPSHQLAGAPQSQAGSEVNVKFVLNADFASLSADEIGLLRGDLQAISPGVWSVAGGGVFGNVGDNKMVKSSDSDREVYEFSKMLLPGNYKYVFVNSHATDDWGAEEQLQGDSRPCVDQRWETNQWHDRDITVPDDGSTEMVVALCFSQCTVRGPAAPPVWLDFHHPISTLACAPRFGAVCGGCGCCVRGTRRGALMWPNVFGQLFSTFRSPKKGAKPKLTPSESTSTLLNFPFTFSMASNRPLASSHLNSRLSTSPFWWTCRSSTTWPMAAFSWPAAAPLASQVTIR